MNPFHPNTAEDFTETDLIAFHLHELPPERERAVLRAMAGNPALAAESESVAASLNALKDVPMHVDRTVLDRNWRALRPSLVPHARPAFLARRWRLPVFAGAAMAFAATLAFVVTQRPSTPSAAPEVAHSGPVTPHAPSMLTQNPAAAMGDGRQDRSRLKANLNSGLFHPKAGHPDALVHLLSPAQAPSTPPPAPRLTFTPAPAVPVTPPSPAHDPEHDGAQPSNAEQMPMPAFSKTNPAPPLKARREHTMDMMLAIGGNFIAPRSGQTATRAITAVGALHQQFRPALGYRITASYSRPDFGYNYPGLSSSYGTVHINSRIYELAGTYVVQGPHHGRFKTSVDVGAGLLAFQPSSTYESPGSVFRVAGIGGVNMDVAVTGHWGARTSYRAKVFRGPNFVYTDAGVPVTSAVTVSNETSVGITYRFGKKNKP